MFRLWRKHRYRWVKLSLFHEYMSKKCWNVATRCVLRAHNAAKCNCGQGCSPDPARGAYRAPRLPSWFYKGPLRSGEGRGRETKGREGRGREREERSREEGEAEERLTLMRSWNRAWQSSRLLLFTLLREALWMMVGWYTVVCCYRNQNVIPRRKTRRHINDLQTLLPLPVIHDAALRHFCIYFIGERRGEFGGSRIFFHSNYHTIDVYQPGWAVVT